jgi:hypothetical protein
VRTGGQLAHPLSVDFSSSSISESLGHAPLLDSEKRSRFKLTSLSTTSRTPSQMTRPVSVDQWLSELFTDKPDQKEVLRMLPSYDTVFVLDDTIPTKNGWWEDAPRAVFDLFCITKRWG